MSTRLRCSVIPLLGGSDAQTGKRPAIRWLEYSHRTPSPHELHRWFVVDGHSAFGVVCGRISRLVVLDIDDPGLAAAFVDAFPDLVDTLVVESGIRKTPHFYWRVSYAVSSCSFPGGDLKGDGGYVVGPGSSIGSARWEVAIDRPIRAISHQRLQAVLHFFQKRVPKPQPEAPTKHPTKNAADFVALYHHYVDRYRSRNRALFQTGCYVRDHGHSETWAVATLAALHAAEPACGQHPSENYTRRYAEALRTLHSVYSRAPRNAPQEADQDKRASRLPNSIREALLVRRDGAAVARVLEGAVLCGMVPGEGFTEADLCRKLANVVCR
ncbi:MAG: bifunctional DNA primase/polymerase, partial [Anaerolineae bacterium]|nr:bifunctional DNA primase/polymerase [Anaerolineae bacterium]